MEVLLFFCGACLKGERDTVYYDLLEIEKSANADQIKKAYKKMSLELHPDRLSRKGIQVTAEHNQKFQKLKEAYDVLSDPRKKRLYDKLGESGMKLIENPREVDPTILLKNFQANRGERIKTAITVAFIFSAILIFPILFCLKCDGKLDNAPWLAIWTPMWLVNAVMAIGALLFLCSSEDDSDDDELDENGEVKEKPEKIPLTTKLMFASQTFVYILIQIFVLMRLDKEVEWSWFRVFIPWFIYEALALLEKFPVAFSSIPEVDPALASAVTHIDEETGEQAGPEIQLMMLETERMRKLIERATMRSGVVVCLLRIWFACFLAARLDEDNHWDWGLVMFPIWAYFLLELVVGYIFRQWGTQLMKEADIDLEALESGLETDPVKLMKFQYASELISAGSASCCIMSPVMLMAILLVSRLDSTSFSTFIIILPVFLFLGCCMCGVGCGLCYLTCADTGEGSEVGSDDPGSRMMPNETAAGEMEAEQAKYTPPDIEEVEKKSAASAAVYGTFDPNGSRYQEDEPEEPEAKRVVHETTIDVDID